MRQLIKITNALSDKNRIIILKLLEHKYLCVCELQNILDISQPTVSNHLRILQEAGLVKYYKEGRWIIYQLEKIENTHIAKLIGNALDYLKSEKVIRALLIKLDKISRHNICNAKRK